MPLYVNGKNINIGRTAENYATSAAAILTEDQGFIRFMCHLRSILA